MSFITTMAVPDGIIMLGDLLCARVRNKDGAIPEIPLVGTKFYKKLFSMNDNIGISLCGCGDYAGQKGLDLSSQVKEFCRKKSFDNPREAAEALLDYILYGDNKCDYHDRQHYYSAYGEPEFVVHVAGYWKHKENGLMQPSVYAICTVPSLLQEGWQRIGYAGSTGLWQCGNMRQIKHYVGMINNDKDFIGHCTLQDAVNAVLHIFDAARGFEWMIDHIETMSEDFEMLALTKDGIKWLRKHELEVKEKREVIL